MKHINKLPDELINKIMKMYWQNIYKMNVINKINEKNILIDNIYKYMLKHGVPNILLGFGHPTDKLHYYYYKNHNKVISSNFLIKNKKENNLLKYQHKSLKNIHYIIGSGMLNNVSELLKCICSFYIINYYQESKKILKYFVSLSNLIGH